MTADADPKGLVRDHAPKRVDHTIDAWGYVGGRVDRRKQYAGLAFLALGVVGIVVCFLLYRLGDNNLHRVSDEWYRSAQPGGPEIKAMIRDNGIKTVLRLVGTDDGNQRSFAEESVAVAEANATLIVCSMATSRLPYRSELSRLFEALDTIEPPVLVHCDAGSDRTGLASVIWLHDYRDRPLKEARKQMDFFPYGHVRFGAAHAISDFLDQYEAFLKANPGSKLKIREWVRDHYFVEKEGRKLAPWYDGKMYQPS